MQGFGGTNGLCGAAQSTLLLKGRDGEDDPASLLEYRNQECPGCSQSKGVRITGPQEVFPSFIIF